MRCLIAFLFSFLLFAYPTQIYALVVTCGGSSTTEIGYDGTDGIDSGGNTGTTHSVTFSSSTLLINTFEVDFSAFGTGEG